jgi:hypothetical protein
VDDGGPLLRVQPGQQGIGRGFKGHRGHRPSLGATADSAPRPGQPQDPADHSSGTSVGVARVSVSFRKNAGRTKRQ